MKSGDKPKIRLYNKGIWMFFQWVNVFPWKVSLFFRLLRSFLKSLVIFLSLRLWEKCTEVRVKRAYLISGGWKYETLSDKFLFMIDSLKRLWVCVWVGVMYSEQWRSRIMRVSWNLQLSVEIREYHHCWLRHRKTVGRV